MYELHFNMRAVCQNEVTQCFTINSLLTMHIAMCESSVLHITRTSLPLNQRTIIRQMLYAVFAVRATLPCDQLQHVTRKWALKIV